jgi:hypothetical protein
MCCTVCIFETRNNQNVAIRLLYHNDDYSALSCLCNNYMIIRNGYQTQNTIPITLIRLFIFTIADEAFLISNIKLFR